MIIRAIFSLALLLASAVPVLSADAEAQAKAAVTARLKDPESARFTDIVVKGDRICGRVNAKNSFGGYVGPRFWIYETVAGTTMIADQNQEISINIVDSLVRPGEDFCK